MNISKIIIAAVAAASLTSVVQAQESRSIAIDTAGYDLTNPVIVEKLHNRISAAASVLCGVGQESDLKLDRMTRSCAKASAFLVSNWLRDQLL